MKWLRPKKTFNFKIIDIIDKLPLAMIAGLTGFSLVVSILLLLNQFQTALIWTLGPVVALFCAWIVFKFGSIERPGTTKMRLVCDLIVIIGVLAWGGYNIFFTSQHILTNRDPAIYANAASWLSEKTDLKIIVPDTLKGVKGVSPGFDNTGFSVDRGPGDVVYVQGQHLLPALLGSIGKFIGPKNILHLNILFGMMALLAIYCFARLFMKSYWAMIGAGVMAASMPMLYFSRDIYTEPLTATFIFGGLALIGVAQRNKHLALWFLAGLVMGASVLTRIDSYLSLIGVAVFLTVYTVFAKKEDYKRRLLNILFFAIPTLLMCFLGLLDLILLSKNYYIDTLSLTTQEIATFLIVIVIGVVGNFIAIKKPSLLIWLDEKTVRWRAMAGAILVLLVGLFLISRPILYKIIEAVYGFVTNTVHQQNLLGVSHDYSDITTNWVSWYIGSVLACLGLIGLAYALYKSIKSNNLIYTCGLFVILGTSFVYFIKPSVSPDQIWASRRMLPVIMPGIAVFGVYMLSIITEKLRFSSIKFKNAIIVIASIGILITPLVTSKPLIIVRDTTEYAFVTELCAKLPSNATVLWVGVGRIIAVQPTRGYCNVESYGYLLNGIEKPTVVKLAEIAKSIRSRGRIPVIGLINDQASVLINDNDQDMLSLLTNISYKKLESTFTTPPQVVDDVMLKASGAIIETDGSLRQITK